MTKEAAEIARVIQYVQSHVDRGHIRSADVLTLFAEVYAINMEFYDPMFNRKKFFDLCGLVPIDELNEKPLS